MVVILKAGIFEELRFEHSFNQQQIPVRLTRGFLEEHFGTLSSPDEYCNLAEKNFVAIGDCVEFWAAWGRLEDRSVVLRAGDWR